MGLRNEVKITVTLRTVLQTVYPKEQRKLFTDMLKYWISNHSVESNLSFSIGLPVLFACVKSFIWVQCISIKYSSNIVDDKNEIYVNELELPAKINISMIKQISR